MKGGKRGQAAGERHRARERKQRRIGMLELGILRLGSASIGNNPLAVMSRKVW